GVLPTALASSTLSLSQVLFTLCGFVLFYSTLLVIDVTLMRRYIVMGPVKALAPHAASPASGRPSTAAALTSAE
ncbi:cytochrome ubiquinol oxidase subunit I, partial [Acinetobacter baumannii]